MKTSAFLILAVLVLIGGYILFFHKSASLETSNVTPSPTQDANTYVDDKFGISFNYDSAQVALAPQGTSSIKIYAIGTIPTEGQSIARFEKSPNETLSQSIRRQILQGYSTSTCSIETSTFTNNYVKAEITYPAPDESPLGHEGLCNASYDKTNGIRYFLYDPQHADRFYFVDIGQYPLLAKENTPWPDTIVIR